MDLSGRGIVDSAGLSTTPGVNETTKLEDDAVVHTASDATFLQTFLFETWLCEFTHGLPSFFVTLLLNEVDEHDVENRVLLVCSNS